MVGKGKMREYETEKRRKEKGERRRSERRK